MQEVSFWLNLQHALNHIKEERESTHVNLTLEVLKHARRFHATVRCDLGTRVTASICCRQ